MGVPQRRDLLVLLLADLDGAVISGMSFSENLPSPSRAIAEYLSGKTAAEIDALLASAGAPTVTPPSYGLSDAEWRKRQIAIILAGCPNDVMRRLAMLVDMPPSDEWEAAGMIVRGSSVPWDEAHGDYDLWEEAGFVDAPALPASASPDGAIFVVHGHASAILHEVVRVLERATDREVVVLHEQPNQGRTILEKFELHAAGASYAVVLLTADDEGGTRESDSRRPRGRQNVIFELGFFFGRLGRGRVAVLLDPQVERPSDVDGLVYVPLDGPGAWKRSLTRELEAVGISVDHAKIP